MTTTRRNRDQLEEMALAHMWLFHAARYRRAGRRADAARAMDYAMLCLRCALPAA